MKKSNLAKPTFIEVGLIVRTPHLRIVSAYAYVVVAPEIAAHNAAKGFDLVSLLDTSLSRSLVFFFPFHSIVELNVRIIDPSLVTNPVPFKGRDTFQIASNLVADILGQIL